MTREEALQREIFSFLMNSATHWGALVRRIDTHAASVFLAADRAYRVKKAVRFPYLDYTSVEKRRAACLRELQVNRAFAPGLYRGVIPITRAEDDFLLGGDGEAVEWAIVMERFDGRFTLDQLAIRGEISDELASELGAMIAKLHGAAPVFDATRWINHLDEIIRYNDRELREAAYIFGKGELDFLRDRSAAIFERVRPLLAERGSRGFVREGHGDLHLANIALIDAKPVAFDAIEFDPLLAAGDVLYDLAFLLMALVERELTRKANIVLNRYLIEIDEEEHLDGLAVFRGSFPCVQPFAPRLRPQN